jgi:hypothetical protein
MRPSFHRDAFAPDHIPDKEQPDRQYALRSLKAHRPGVT